MTDANISNINGGNWVAHYSYYKNGDMISRLIQGNQTNFAYSGNQMITAGGDNLSYDKNGQLTTGVGTSLVWNWDGKLRSGQKSGNSISLKYDPAGNRIHKNSTANGNRKYIVDVVGTLPTILLEIDDSNDVIKKTYIYADSQIIAQHDGNSSDPRYFYLHDRLGSVREIINASGNVVKYYTYQPFGETIESGGTLVNPFGFSGQFFDDDTSQYYLRARMYDPSLMRFTSRDPVDGKFEQPLMLHKYLYCGNDPINKVDFTGRWRTSIHDNIIFDWLTDTKDFLKGNIDVGEIRSMEEGSEYVDWHYQAQDEAYMHAMRAPGQSIKDAKAAMKNFISFYLSSYEEFKDSGASDYRNLAYTCLGMAMHPVMDSTDPLHKGFRIWWGLGDSRGRSHVWNEPKSIDNGTLQETKALMNEELRSYETNPFWNQK